MWLELDLHETGHRLGARLRPIGIALDRVGLTPNVLTALGLPLALAAGFYAYTGSYVYSAVLLALNLLFDVLDGITARATCKVTRFGELMDKVLDRYSWLLLFAGLLLAGRVHGFWAAMAIYGSLIRGYISRTAESRGARYQGIFSVTIGVRPILLVGLLLGMVNEAVVLVAVVNNGLALAQLFVVARILRRFEKP